MMSFSDARMYGLRQMLEKDVLKEDNLCVRRGLLSCLVNGQQHLLLVASCLTDEYLVVEYNLLMLRCQPKCNIFY